MATVWMGLTAGCAVCHDHKFDPLQQKEYYRLYAYFNSMADPPMDGNALRTPPVVRLPSPEQTKKQAAVRKAVGRSPCSRCSRNWRRSNTPNRPSRRRGLRWPRGRIAVGLGAVTSQRQEEVAARAGSAGAGGRAGQADGSAAEDDPRLLPGERLRENARSCSPALQQQIAVLSKKLADLDQEIPASLVTEELPARRPAFVLRRGEYDKPQEQVEPGVPAIFPPLPKDAPNNRLGLARWLVGPAHPLTARVIVNRFWQQYFGTGIVKTAEDFGSQGEWPSHPELLDWLATEFMRQRLGR